MKREQEDLLRKLALNDEAALETVLGATLGCVEPQSLDPKAHALVRLAALIALEAPPASYQWCIATAQAAGATDDELIGVLVALAPVVGLARVSSAAPELALAAGYDIDAALET